MAPKRHERVRALFDAAVELPPDERAAFLDAACGTDAGLRAEVVELLAFDSTPSEQTARNDFLKSPLVRSAPLAPADGPVSSRRVGRYRLLCELGSGGMGTVYEAEQDNPRRSVALKVIRAGLAAPAVVKRFVQEAQILGRLHHPGIAQVYEAGATEEGQPYFAMELIRGAPLDQYACQHALNAPSRLALFARVCDAVQHAHDKGIVHRDLKPGNILVTEAGQPKVLDFGVARATDADLRTTTGRTEAGQLIGTLGYMSPEQIAADPALIDHRSDVYTLGVILYELLADRPPYDLTGLPLPEVARVIRDQDPPALGAFNAALRGDVETIGVKALEKEPARRYASAGELAADVRRHLDHKPILAGPPSATYRLAKFVRRNRPQVVAGGLVISALLVGIVGTTAGLIRAENRREEAEQARRYEAEQRSVAEAARSREAEQRAAAEAARGHEAEQRARAEKGASRTRAALDALTLNATGSTLDDDLHKAQNEPFLIQALPYYQDLAAEQPYDEASRVRVAGATFRVGVIQFRMRRYPEAEAAFLRTIDAYTRLAADVPTVPEHRRQLLISHENLAQTMSMMGKPGEADHYRRGFAVREKMAADFPGLPWCQQSLALGHLQMGLRITLRSAQSSLSQDEHFGRATTILEQLVTDFPTNTEYRRDLADAHGQIGSLWMKEKPSEAERHLRRAIDTEKKRGEFPGSGDSRYRLALSHHVLSEALSHWRRATETEEQLRISLAIWEKLVTDFPTEPEYRNRLSRSRLWLAGHLFRSGKKAEWHQEYRLGVEAQKQLCALNPGSDKDRALLAHLCDQLGAFAIGRGDGVEAERHLREVVILREQITAQRPNNSMHQNDLADSYCRLGVTVRDNARPGEALVWFEKAQRLATALREREPNSPREAELLGTIHRCRAVAYYRLGKAADAAKEWDRFFELTPKVRTRLLTPQIEFPRANSLPDATADVAVLSASEDWTADQIYSFACVYATADTVSLAKRNEYSGRAVEFLRRAVKAGFADADKAAADSDLILLHNSDDFKKWLADLRKK